MQQCTLVMNGGCTDESQSNMAPLVAETGSTKYPVLQQWSESPDVCTAGQTTLGSKQIVSLKIFALVT